MISPKQKPKAQAHLHLLLEEGTSYRSGTGSE